MDQKCKCFKSVSSGILLLLVWSILLSAAGGSIITVTQLLFLDNNQQYILVLWSGLWVLLPVAGWMGDSFLGRYRAIIVGVFIAVLSFLILLCATVMLEFNLAPIPAIALLCVYILANIHAVWEVPIQIHCHSL